ncbi:hypothetical protein [Bradyrhizobium genosp. P]
MLGVSAATIDRLLVERKLPRPAVSGGARHIGKTARKILFRR